MNDKVTISDDQKSKFTEMLDRGGAVVNTIKKDHEAFELYLVPSNLRPGHRTEQVFHRDFQKNCDWECWSNIHSQQEIDELPLPSRIRKILRNGLENHKLDKQSLSHKDQNMVATVIDKHNQKIYALYQLPKNWQSDGKLQLFVKGDKVRSRAGWRHKRNYNNARNINEDRNLPRTVRQSLVKTLTH